MQPSVWYRNWLRHGIRIFDTEDGILLPGERINTLSMAALEAAAELLGLNWRKARPPGYEPQH